jgi:hypothetical protein
MTAIAAAAAAIASGQVNVAAAAVGAAFDVVARDADRHIRSPAVVARMINAIAATTRLDTLRVASAGLPEIDRASREALVAAAALDQATRRAT